MQNEELTYVIEQLSRRKDQLNAVSKATGFHRRTLRRIVAQTCVPTLGTLDALHKYLKDNARKKEL